MIGRFGDFGHLPSFHEQVFLCFCAFLSLRLELDVAAVPGSGSVFPSISWSSSSGLSGVSSLSSSFSFASSFGFSCSCTSGTTLGSVASSVVIDLGFCGVSTTALRFSSDQLFSASHRTLRAYTTPSSVRTKCSSVRSLFPSHTPDFHLSANFGAGFPDPFPTSGRCAITLWNRFELLPFLVHCFFRIWNFHRLRHRLRITIALWGSCGSMRSVCADNGLTSCAHSDCSSCLNATLQVHDKDAQMVWLLFHTARTKNQ